MGVAVGGGGCAGFLFRGGLSRLGARCQRSASSVFPVGSGLVVLTFDMDLIAFDELSDEGIDLVRDFWFVCPSNWLNLTVGDVIPVGIIEFFRNKLNGVSGCQDAFADAFL